MKEKIKYAGYFSVYFAAYAAVLIVISALSWHRYVSTGCVNGFGLFAFQAFKGFVMFGGMSIVSIVVGFVMWIISKVKRS